MEEQIREFNSIVFTRAIMQVMHTEPSIVESSFYKNDDNNELDLAWWIPDEFAEFSVRLYTTTEELIKGYELSSLNCKMYFETRHCAYGPHNIGHFDEDEGIICTTVDKVGTVIEEILMIFGLEYYNERKQHIIQNVKKETIDETECSVCLEPWEMSDYRIVQLSVCKHVFCERCISNWCLQKNTCPLCRTII